MEVVFTFVGTFGGVYARFWTNAIHLHVGSKGYGLVRSHYAKQWSRRGPEDHCHAVTGDGAAAKRGDHEPERYDQGTNGKVDSVRESERARTGSRGSEKRAGLQKHYGRCISGSVGHPGSTRADVTNPETETGELRGKVPQFSFFLLVCYSRILETLNAAQCGDIQRRTHTA